MLSAPFWTPAETKISVLLSASVERFGVSRMRDFIFIKSDSSKKCYSSRLEMNLSELIASWCLAPPDSSRCMCRHGSQNNLLLWKEQVITQH